MQENKVLAALIAPFRVLRNGVFAKLYFAQTVSLLGDAFTWIGLALVSYQFGAQRSAVILATALTLRVLAFIVFSPFAGVLADRIDRKKILYVTHFIRMGIVFGMVFISAEWHIYVLVFLLNVFNAFFTPTYRSIIPHIVPKADYRQAIGLSAATFQLLGVLGPGLAGILAVWFGPRNIFLIDAASFVLAGILILTLPGELIGTAGKRPPAQAPPSTWADIAQSARLLFSNRLIRFALVIEFISAIAGAQILVNTVGHVKEGLSLTDRDYGWVMAAFGIGATVAAFFSGSFDKTKSRRVSLVVGSGLLGLAIVTANFVGFAALTGLWVVAGLGQSLAEIPSETLIGENIDEAMQGKVYGAHFAFSHLWWAIAYPVAGFWGSRFPDRDFLYGGLLTLGLLAAALIFFRPNRPIAAKTSINKDISPQDWGPLLNRPGLEIKKIEPQVQAVLDEVRIKKDEALYAYTRQFDGVELSSLKVSPDEMAAGEKLDESLKAAIIQARKNITAFHQAQTEKIVVVETMPGVHCWRRSVPIDKVGLYVPSGSAPLFSTVLMLGIPAVLAGCQQIVLCSPPGKDGRIHPAILFAAALVGIDQIFKVGGIQAIAAMAYGSESIPRVDKIFGPGNQYVTMAKQLVNRQGVAIDMPAGPSEVLILADSTADPGFVAADLLAQAEHGADSQCLLVSTSEALIELVYQEVSRQLESTPRREIAARALQNCRLVFIADPLRAMDFTNAYAPEHLIIMTEDPQADGLRVKNAGSVFLGQLAPVSVGDYASGTNHTLPTNGGAAAYSGVSLDSFVKKITFQNLSADGLRTIGPIVKTMARAEHLTAHSDAVSIRLDSINVR